jgi:hypothetical protein
MADRKSDLQAVHDELLELRRMLQADGHLLRASGVELATERLCRRLKCRSHSR